MLISCLPRRKIICGFSPPRAAIQRRTGEGYIENSICVASGLVTERPWAPKSHAAWKPRLACDVTQILVVRNRAENDGARRGAQAVDDDRLARSAQALIFVDVTADPAAAIISNPDHRMARAHPCQQRFIRRNTVWKTSITGWSCALLSGLDLQARRIELKMSFRRFALKRRSSFVTL